jgi:PAS domain-containing protein/DNA-binding CsgD family transcriptional regulator
MMKNDALPSPPLGRWRRSEARVEREAQLDLAIGTLYEAAVEPQRWAATLTAIADLLGAVGAQFFLWDKQASAAPFAAVGRLPDEGNAAYVRYYGAIDPRREALERVPVGKLFTADEHFDEGRFRKSEFFNDFLVPYGVPYVAGGRVLQTTALSAVVAVLRNFGQGPFEPRELAMLERLMPHLQRAARLHSQIGGLRRQNQALEAALDRLTFGVLITDGAGRVMLLNRASEEMAAANDGLLLQGGRLEVAQSKEAIALTRCIAEAVRTAGRRGTEGGGSICISRPSGRRPFAVLVAPLSPETMLAAEHQVPAALILITDLERRPQVLGRRLVELFGLTAAEACLAVALIAGKRLEDIAEERGVRMPTLRTQMRAILDKTGTDRQADLMRLIVGLPALRVAR